MPCSAVRTAERDRTIYPSFHPSIHPVAKERKGKEMAVTIMRSRLWQRHTVDTSSSWRRARRTQRRRCSCSGVNKTPDTGVDLVLSSGFLAFAYHCGFLDAVAEKGLAVKGVMGTSAGAISGSLLASGLKPSEVAAELSALAPIDYMRVHNRPWEGLLDMQGVTQRLRELLPSTFEELPIPFACAVVDSQGKYRVVRSGPLAEAVTASAAVPVLFAPVTVPGYSSCRDGGISDRVGMDPWLESSGRTRPTIVHIIQRSSPFSGKDAVDDTMDGVVIVRSPKSGQTLLSLDSDTFKNQRGSARDRTRATLAAHTDVLNVSNDVEMVKTST